MATGGFAAKGSTLTFSGTQVKELTDINIDLGGPEEVDLSSHDSPDDTEEIEPGLIRSGTVDITGVFVPTDPGQQALITALQARTEAAVVVTCADAGAATFTGTAFYKSFKPTLPYRGKGGFTASLRVQGKLTFAP